MNPHSQFVTDQLDAVAADLRARAQNWQSTIALTAHHRATALLINQLLTSLGEGLTLCEHLATQAPQRLGWLPGQPSLGCFMCSVAASATNQSELCDLCGQQPVGGGLAAAGLSVGPVLIACAGCPGCVAAKRRSPMDLRSARQQIHSEVTRLYLESTK